MRQNYYALVAGLPDILPVSRKLPDTSVEFRELLREEVTPRDFALVELLYLPFDHENLLNRYFKKEAGWNHKGNFPAGVIEIIAGSKNPGELEGEPLPRYLADFAEQFHEGEQNYDYYAAEKKLASEYLEYLTAHDNEFVKNIATYNQNISNLMAALNCRKFNLPLENALVGDNQVTDALRKSRSRDFGLSNEIPGIESLIQLFDSPSILDRELKLDIHKWDYLDEITFFDYFSIERILAFILKIFVVERWIGLEPARGDMMFNRLLNDLGTITRVAGEFNTAHGKKK